MPVIAANTKIQAGYHQIVCFMWCMCQLFSCEFVEDSPNDIVSAFCMCDARSIS